MFSTQGKGKCLGNRHTNFSGHYTIYEYIEYHTAFPNMCNYSGPMKHFLKCSELSLLPDLYHHGLHTCYEEGLVPNSTVLPP